MTRIRRQLQVDENLVQLQTIYFTLHISLVSFYFTSHYPHNWVMKLINILIFIFIYDKCYIISVILSSYMTKEGKQKILLYSYNNRKRRRHKGCVELIGPKSPIFEIGLCMFNHADSVIVLVA